MTKLFKKHALPIFAIFITLTVSLLPAFVAAETNVLLLWDADTEGTAALVDALEAAGYAVTLPPVEEYKWNGNNPQLTDFDVVIHLNGATFHTPLPIAAQVALQDFVANGGGYIGEQFNGYEQASGQQVDMPQLVLQLWPYPDNCNECEMTWTVVPGQEAHPVLEGVPESFTFFADAHDAGQLVEFDEDPSTVLMTSPAGGPAVIVREFKAGRIVSFSHATNTSTDLTLQDVNIQQLYINAVAWTAPEEPEPEITIPDLIDQVKTLIDERKVPRLSGFLLILELKIALRNQEEGHFRRAIKMLRVFKRHVKKLVHLDRMAPEDGQPLIDGAMAIIEQLREEATPENKENCGRMKVKWSRFRNN